MVKAKSVRERTEDEIVSQAGIKVILGGQEYIIKPLVIRESREWRRKYAEITTPIFNMVNKTAESVEEFGNIYRDFLTAKPDEAIDLFFDYARDLPRGKIEASATDAELAKAFEAVVELALPLASSLPKSMGRLSR